MLIAVVMLFLMSYWLLSKVEARHWKAPALRANSPIRCRAVRWWDCG